MSAYSWDKVRRLALVNRKFKEVVYGTPSCWSMIGDSDSSSNRERDRTSRLLEMSRGNPLRFHLRNGIHADALTRHSTRCVSLHTGSRDVGKMPQDLSLPLLEELELEVGNDWGHVTNVLTRWHLPGLRSLIGLNSVFVPDKIMAQLTTLKLTSIFLERNEEIQTLLKKLREAPSLHSLDMTMHIEEFANFDYLDDPDRAFADVSLPSLTHLSLGFDVIVHHDEDDMHQGQETQARIVTAVSRSLRMPQIRSIALTIDLACDGDDDGDGDDNDSRDCNADMLQRLHVDKFFPPRSLPTGQVQHFCLRLPYCPKGELRAGQEMAASYPRHFPALQSFTLGYEGGTDVLQQHARDLARLDDLRLEECTRLTIADFEVLLDAIFKQEVVNLKSITVMLNGRNRRMWMTNPSVWSERFNRFNNGDSRIIFT